MDVRDAVEADAEDLAAIADGPADVMRNLIHDRSVRVAVERAATAPRDAEDDVGSDQAEAEETESGEDADDDGAERKTDHPGGTGEGPGEAGGTAEDSAEPAALDDESGASMLGFVSFDARADAVHVTQLAGTRPAITRLLEEPLAFARREGMPVELLVPADGGSVRDAVEDAGFDERGAGPRFEGDATVRYRFER